MNIATSALHGQNGESDANSNSRLRNATALLALTIVVDLFVAYGLASYASGVCAEQSSAIDPALTAEQFSSTVCVFFATAFALSRLKQSGREMHRWVIGGVVLVVAETLVKYLIFLSLMFLLTC